ncbi:MAG: hypothetical protein ACRDRF_21375, partial [Pseudonocardiaceae bacterium]
MSRPKASSATLTALTAGSASAKSVITEVSSRELRAQLRHGARATRQPTVPHSAGSAGLSGAELPR